MSRISRSEWYNPTYEEKYEELTPLEKAQLKLVQERRAARKPSSIYGSETALRTFTGASPAEPRLDRRAIAAQEQALQVKFQDDIAGLLKALIQSRSLLGKGDTQKAVSTIEKAWDKIIQTISSQTSSMRSQESTANQAAQSRLLTFAKDQRAAVKSVLAPLVEKGIKPDLVTDAFDEAYLGLLTTQPTAGAGVTGTRSLKAKNLMPSFLKKLSQLSPGDRTKMLNKLQTAKIAGEADASGTLDAIGLGASTNIAADIEAAFSRLQSLPEEAGTNPSLPGIRDEVVAAFYEKELGPAPSGLTEEKVREAGKLAGHSEEQINAAVEANEATRPVIRNVLVPEAKAMIKEFQTPGGITEYLKHLKNEVGYAKKIGMDTWNEALEAVLDTFGAETLEEAVTKLATSYGLNTPQTSTRQDDALAKVQAEIDQRTAQIKPVEAYRTPLEAASIAMKGTKGYAVPKKKPMEFHTRQGRGVGRTLRKETRDAVREKLKKWKGSTVEDPVTIQGGRLAPLEETDVAPVPGVGRTVVGVSPEEAEAIAKEILMKPEPKPEDEEKGK